ncbi:hypothetical protein ACCO45_004130 [Purpureocillium lilacinum]|uniref:Uncharacterized protein n=1 Tax=Purpureocillium lilacinum TaxID=33203 RepID=A0ACC4E2U9_PURLI
MQDLAQLVNRDKSQYSDTWLAWRVTSCRHSSKTLVEPLAWAWNTGARGAVYSRKTSALFTMFACDPSFRSREAQTLGNNPRRSVACYKLQY